jgi:hypothetical protein
MKQNDKYDTPKSVAEMFSNFSKQIHGYAGEVQARNKGKTCKSSANKTIKFTRKRENTRRFNQMLGIKTDLTKIWVHCSRWVCMLDFVVLFVCAFSVFCL